MKILFYGAGIIGQIYAAKLFKSGIDTTLLARRKNYEKLKNSGVTIYNVLTKEEINVEIPLICELKENDNFELIIVTVRLDQLESVKNSLAASENCKTILFMLNNPIGIQTLEKDFPDKKIILGFPGVGGTRQENRINYIQIKEQKTTLGDYNGNISEITKKLKKTFEQTGLQVVLEKDMKAWLIIHSVFIASASAAITLENGDSRQLGKNKKSVENMVQSIKEGLKACKELGLPIIPQNLKTIFLTMPKWFAVLYWSRAMKGKIGSLSIAPHANTARNEMQLLAEQVMKITAKSSFKTPTLNKLLSNYMKLK